MASIEALVAKMRANPRGTRFTDLRKGCEHYVGEPRQTTGSHAVFKMPWPGDPRVNIQDDKGKAKSYQVRQTLAAIDRLSREDQLKGAAMTDLSVDVAHYTYRVSWSPDDGEFVGTCVELPSLSWLAPDKLAAMSGIETLVAEVAGDMTRAGEILPVPLAERPFSGKFLVRVSPDLHRRLTTLAAEQNVSLNRFIEEHLAAAI